jgi:nicotinamide-nucleotide amidase
MELLGVPESLLREHGAVSAECAAALAAGVRAKLATDIGVGIVGYAGPDAGEPDKPVGTVFVAVAGPRGLKQSTFIWPGTRVEVQNRAAKMALNAVRLYLLDIE